MAKFKDKERILKAARDKQLVIQNGVLIGQNGVCSDTQQTYYKPEGNDKKYYK